MKKVIVNRSEWARGEFSTGSLYEEDKFCILGFVGHQLYGMSKEQMEGASSLEEVISLTNPNVEIPRNLLNAEVEIFCQNDAEHCEESTLQEMFRNVGIEVEFVG